MLKAWSSRLYFTCKILSLDQKCPKKILEQVEVVTKTRTLPKTPV